MELEDERPDHLVLVPCPLYGHLNPMLHLANLLLSNGFSVTVIRIPSPVWTSVVLPSFPGRLFIEPIGGDVDGSSVGDDVMSFLLELNSTCEEPFRRCMRRVGRPVSCVIHDAIMYFPVDTVDNLRIRRLVLRTSTAANFLGLSILNQKSFLPPQESGLVKGLEELPSMRVKDLPLFDKGSRESTERVLSKVHQGTTTASAIVWNTLTCLEQSSIDKITESFSVPIFPVGPLHKLSKEIGVAWASSDYHNTDQEEESCSIISWLDSQAPGSVVYVSFGSLVTLGEHQLAEIARGLSQSGCPFLWVVRGVSADRIRDLAGALVGSRGKIVTWAPQREVMAHRSVGCFWTHNGWNSTLESMSEGVLMLCWPNVGDQRVIAGLVTGAWKVGLELEVAADNGSLDGDRVAGAIGRMMSTEEGKEMKRRAMALKEEIEVSTRQGGSSCQSLSKLVDFIRSSTC